MSISCFMIFEKGLQTSFALKNPRLLVVVNAAANVGNAIGRYLLELCPYLADFHLADGDVAGT